MKRKTSLILLLSLIVSVMMAGCQKITSDVTVSDSDLVGRWAEEGTQVYWHFTGSHDGETWDEADDVHEGEDGSTHFTWSLSGSDVTCQMQGQMGQVVPKVYTITSMGADSFTWRNSYGISTTFIKK